MEQEEKQEEEVDEQPEVKTIEIKSEHPIWKWLRFIVILCLIGTAILVISFYVSAEVVIPMNNFDVVTSTLTTSINFSDVWNLESGSSSASIFDVEHQFVNTNLFNFQGIKQYINISNTLHIQTIPFTYSLKVNIDTNQVRWNGTIYDLTTSSQRLNAWTDPETLKLVTPNIFFGVENKRINFRDISERGGYVLIYNTTVEMRIDDLVISSDDSFFLDPTYYNQSDGFSTAVFNCGNPGGITTNGSDFWILDSDDDFIYHTDAQGNNITEAEGTPGFPTPSISGIDNSYGITTNGSDFWITESWDHWVYHTDAQGNNITDGFPTGSLGFNYPNSITTNGSDFWIIEVDDLVYRTNKSGYDFSDSFDVGVYGADNSWGITTNGSDFWITDLVDNWVYHINSSGDNQSDGFSTAVFGSETPYAIAIDTFAGIGRSGTPLNFWITNPTDDFVYHINITETGTTPPIINLQFPFNNTNWTTPYINFTFNTTDEGSNIDTCNLWLQKSGSWELNSTNSTITETVNQTFNLTIDEQNMLWRVECSDTLNNKANSTTYNITIDSTVPYKVSFDEISDITTSASMQNITLNYIALDSLSGIKNSSYTLTWLAGSRHLAISYNTSFLLPQGIYGEYRLDLYTQDHSGNVNSSYQNFSVTYKQTQSGGAEGSPPPTPGEPSEELEFTLPVEPEIPFSPENPETIPSNPSDASPEAQERINDGLWDLIGRVGDEATPEDFQEIVDQLEAIGIIIDIGKVEVWYNDIVGIVQPIAIDLGGGGGGSKKENIGIPAMIFNEDLSKHIIIMTPFGANSYSLLTSPGLKLARDWIIINLGDQTEVITISLENTGGTSRDPTEWVELTGKAITYDSLLKKYTITIEPGEDLKEVLTNNIDIPNDVKFGEEFFYSLLLSQNNVYLSKLDFQMSMERKSVIFSLKDIIFGARIKIPRMAKEERDKEGNLVLVQSPPFAIPNLVFIALIPGLISLFIGWGLWGKLQKNAITVSLLIFFISATFVFFVFFLA